MTVRRRSAVRLASVVVFAAALGWGGFAAAETPERGVPEKGVVVLHEDAAPQVRPGFEPVELPGLRRVRWERLEALEHEVDIAMDLRTDLTTQRRESAGSSLLLTRPGLQ